MFECHDVCSSVNRQDDRDTHATPGDDSHLDACRAWTLVVVPRFVTLSLSWPHLGIHHDGAQKRTRPHNLR